MRNHAARIAALYRYPVKGLTPEPLQRVRVAPGGTFPFDRAYVIENGSLRFHGTPADLLASDELRRAYLGL